MITQVGGLIAHIREAVASFGVTPHATIIARIGEQGEQMQIESVQVSGWINPTIILQLKKPN